MLFWHDDAPGVLLSAVLDVDEPVLQAQSDGAALAALAGGDLNVAAAVMDQRNGADEELWGGMMSVMRLGMNDD